ncbi:MAG: ankyrin repeat domain-containing protein [Pseudomonadota bacterium]
MQIRQMFLFLAALPLLASAADADLSTLIQGGDRSAALAAVRAGANVNVAQGDGSMPLIWAVYKVDPELTRELLKHGANANAKNALGATPLAEAAKLANPELVQLLIKARADVNEANEDGQTPLMLAARTGSVEVAELLVRAGANVNARELWREQTALMWAAGSGQADMTAYLIKHRADVEARAATNDWGSQVTSEPRAQYRPTGGMTPLLYAIRAGCMPCVQAILKAGADVQRPTPDGVSPLMAALDNLQFDAANYLLDHGANPHVSDWWGRTPLYIAVDMRSFSDRFLIGAGNTPAEAAAPPNLPAALQVMQRLLDAGVDPNIQLNMHRPGRGGNSGRFTDDLLTAGASPLLRAAVSFDSEAIALLLQHGAIVDLPNVMGVTPLMAASGLGVSQRDTRGSYGPDAQDKSVIVLAQLIKAGANVNARVFDTSGHTALIARPSSMTTRQGQTAIFGAINWGWPKVVKFLVENGADLTVKDAAGRTVADALAGKAGGRDFKPSDEVASLIKKAGGA